MISQKQLSFWFLFCSQLIMFFIIFSYSHSISLKVEFFLVAQTLYLSSKQEKLFMLNGRTQDYSLKCSTCMLGIFLYTSTCHRAIILIFRLKQNKSFIGIYLWILLLIFDIGFTWLVNALVSYMYHIVSPHATNDQMGGVVHIGRNLPRCIWLWKCGK